MYAKPNASSGQSSYFSMAKNVFNKGLLGVMLVGSLATGIDRIVEKAHAQEKQAASQSGNESKREIQNGKWQMMIPSGPKIPIQIIKDGNVISGTAESSSSKGGWNQGEQILYGQIKGDYVECAIHNRWGMANPAALEKLDDDGSFFCSYLINSRLNKYKIEKVK